MAILTSAPAPVKSTPIAPQFRRSYSYPTYQAPCTDQDRVALNTGNLLTPAEYAAMQAAKAVEVVAEPETAESLERAMMANRAAQVAICVEGEAALARNDQPAADRIYAGLTPLHREYEAMSARRDALVAKPAPAPAAPAKPASKILFDSAEVRNENGTWTGSQLDAAAERFESWVEANRFDLPEQYRPTFELRKLFPLGRSVASPKAEFGGEPASAEEYAAAHRVGFTAQDRVDFLHGFTVKGRAFLPKPPAVELEIIDMGDHQPADRWDDADFINGNLMTAEELEAYHADMDQIYRENRDRWIDAMELAEAGMMETSSYVDQA